MFHSRTTAHRFRLLSLGGGGLTAALVAGLTFPSVASPSAPAQAPAIAPAGTNARVGAPLPGPWEPSGAYSLTRKLPDGQDEVKVFGNAINYRLDGQWHEINTSLVPSSAAGVAAENAGGPYEVSFPEDASVTPLLFETGQTWVSMKMMGLDSNAPVVRDNTATYGTEGAAAESVTYTVTDGGVKEDIELTSAPSSEPTYTYQVEASAGLRAVEQPDGSIDFNDAHGRSHARVPSGVMYDSNPTGAAKSSSVDFQVTDRAQGGWTLEVTPSQDWLADPERVYPVYVDPSITQTAVRDCWIREDWPTQSRCGNESVFVKAGRHGAGQRVRGLLRFSTSGIPANSSISHASVNMYLDADESTTYNWADYELARVGRPFTGQATWSSSGTAPWVGGAPVGGVVSSVELNGRTSGWKTWDGLETVVQGWNDGYLVNDGLVLRQPDGMGVNNVLSFHSSSTQNSSVRRPYLSVTYGSTPVSRSDLEDLDVTTPENIGVAVIASAAETSLPVVITPHLEDGTRLTEQADGSIAIVDARNNDAFISNVLIGDVLAADGTAVPTTTRLDGGSLVFTVDPENAAALAYPLVQTVATDATAPAELFEPDPEIEINPRGPHGSGGYKRAGCKSGGHKQRYGAGVTFYGMEFTFRYCWTSGHEGSSKIRYIEGGNLCWHNLNYQVANCIGPTWKDRRPLRYDHVSNGYFSNLYFYFQSRQCLPRTNYVCTKWVWHRVGIRAEYGGYTEPFGRY